MLCKKIDNRIVAYCLSAVLIIAFLINNVVIWRIPGFVGIDNTWDYGDFVEPVRTGYGDLYGTNYPPFAVLVFKLFHMFTENNGANEYSLTYSVFLFGFLSALLLYMVSFVAIRKGDVISEKSAMFASLGLMLTSPVLFSFQRLNLVFISLITLIIFYIGHDSSYKPIRYLGLFGLAVSANIKIYPAVFGLVLIKQKKWKDAIVSVVFGILLFLFPIFFEERKEGGLAELIRKFIKAIYGFIADRGRADGMSLRYIVYSVSDRIGNSFLLNHRDTLATCIIVLFVVISAFLFWMTEREYEGYILLAMLCIFIPSVSYWYSTLFIIPALLCLISKKNSYEMVDIIEIMLIVLVLVYVQPYNQVLHIHSKWHLLLLWTLILFRNLYDRLKILRLTNKVEGA